MTMNALTSLWNGSLAGKREQEIFTPPEVTDRLRVEWHEIVLDASSDAGRHVPAQWHYVGVEGMDGLVLPWADRTYSNPPYATLKHWLIRAAGEAQKQIRIASLCPARSHRKWYRRALENASCLVEFNPLRFYGRQDDGSIAQWSAAFPAPLVLICWNWIAQQDVWADVGDVRAL